MTKYAWLPLLAPVIGALLTYLLNRDGKVRRARAAALEDLQLFSGALEVLGAGDPLTDQMKEHARGSVRSYSGHRAARARSINSWVSLGVIACVSSLFGTLFHLLDVQSTWGLVVAGAIGGTAGSVAEAASERIRVRSALRHLPTTTVEAGRADEPGPR